MSSQKGLNNLLSLLLLFMKKVILSLAVLAGTATMASAQSSNALKVNVISPIFKTGSFFFEHKLNDNATGQLGFSFTSWQPDDTKITGFSITPEYRYYLSGEAMDGFYVGPFVRYQSFSLTNEYDSYQFDNNGNMTTVRRKDEGTLNTLGAGVLVGRQWLFKDRFTLDLFAGPSYSGGSVKAKSGSADNLDVSGGLNGFGLRVGLTFGIAF